MGFITDDAHRGIADGNSTSIAIIDRQRSRIQSLVPRNGLRIEQGYGNAGLPNSGQRLMPSITIGIGDIDATDDYQTHRPVQEILYCMLCGGILSTLLCGLRIFSVRLIDVLSGFAIRACTAKRSIENTNASISERVQGHLVCS
ncbi:hypothetical protein Tam1G_0041 [Bifidobacterium imperatoris]|uniref:Uncharacterized protein n=1 Tax=Bifidobacterium imperatoris TaxID=2020965 RepID=A0A2N5IVA0_9BIFI|nr:hypothetical protein Tam1G_0041 [Bifidobacterium imperatoris]